MITIITRPVRAANDGDSDPDMDEALRRVREGAICRAWYCSKCGCINQDNDMSCGYC